MNQEFTTLSVYLNRAAPFAIKNIIEYVKSVGGNPHAKDERLRNMVFAYFIAATNCLKDSIFDPSNHLSRYRASLLEDSARRFRKLSYLWACRLCVTGLINRINSSRDCHLTIDGIGYCFGYSSDIEGWLAYIRLIELTYKSEALGLNYLTPDADPAVDWVIANFSPAGTKDAWMVELKSTKQTNGRLLVANSLLFSVLASNEIEKGMSLREILALEKALGSAILQERISSLLDSQDWLAAANSKFGRYEC
jgi:hypothetical protein